MYTVVYTIIMYVTSCRWFSMYLDVCTTTFESLLQIWGIAWLHVE